MSQGGYFDIALDPLLSVTSGCICLSPMAMQTQMPRIVAGRLEGNSVSGVEPIFTVTPLKDTSVHYGGKMIQSDGTLLMTTGDGLSIAKLRNPYNLMGKVIRISDGSIPADNPFADGENGHPAVWSYGHRNLRDWI